MADQSLIGYQFPAFRFTVEEGKVREFAQSICAAHPAFFDEVAARGQGFDALLAPPTFSTVTLHWQPAQKGNPLKLDLTRVLAGGNEWEYLRPITAGETFTVRTHIADVTQKEGSRGTMTFIIREMGFFDADDELALIARSTIIEMPPRPSKEAV